MNRKRYINKMRPVYVEIYKKGNVPGLGKAFRHLQDADLTKPLNEYGSYNNIWNSKLMQDLRKLYNL